MGAKLNKTSGILLVAVVVIVTVGLLWKFGLVPGNSSGEPSSALSGKESLKEKLAGISQEELWDRLHKLTPSERKELLDQVVKKEDYQAVTRGSLSKTLSAKGSIQSKTMSEVTCPIRADSLDRVAATVSWIIADRAHIEMGKPLVKFHDAPLRQRLKAQQATVAEAEQSLRKAKDDVVQVHKNYRENLLLCELDVKLARNDLKRTDADPQRKQDLLDRMKHMQAVFDMLKSIGPEGAAAADHKARLAIVDDARTRQQILEEDLAHCTLTAAREGQVVYVDKRLRPAIEVTEGQKLMWVCDLSKLKFAFDVKAPQGAAVQAGQKAFISLEGIERPFSAAVTQVEKEATKKTKDELYRVDLDINEKLLPGMKGTVLIVIDSRPDCLRLPLSALLGQGTEKHCLVLEGKELHERRVIAGLVGDKEIVEIKEGLKRGDLVLSDPQTALRRLTQVLKVVRK